MHTWNEIQNMSEAEIAELNKKLQRKLAIKIAATIGVTVAFHVAAAYISKKIAN